MLTVKDLISDLEKGDRSIEVIKHKKEPIPLPIVHWIGNFRTTPFTVQQIQMQQAMMGQQTTYPFLGQAQGILPLAQLLGGGR